MPSRGEYIKSMNYDLEQRTTKFSKELIALCRSITKSAYNQNIISQVLRSGTSVGANYREANGGISKKDFSNKIHICKKEAKETMYWLELLAESELGHKEDITALANECHELTLIFSKIAFSSR